MRTTATPWPVAEVQSPMSPTIAREQSPIVPHRQACKAKI
jgi:hypothetical protein